jgi:putative peptidoglycan lipid II flippase
VLLLCLAGTAVLIAVAIPAAHFLRTYHSQTPQLATSFALFALGLAGYGLVACLSRALLAVGRTTVAAVIVGGGWLLVIAADIVLVSIASAPAVAAMLALGNSIGLTAAGAALLIAVLRIRGRAALRGMLRTFSSGLAAATAGAGMGAAVAAVVPSGAPLQSVFVGLLVAACALAVFTAVAYLLDSGDTRDAIARARRAATR